MGIKDEMELMKLQFEANPTTNPSLFAKLFEDKYTEQERILQGITGITGVFLGIALDELIRGNWLITFVTLVVCAMVQSRLRNMNDRYKLMQEKKKEVKKNERERDEG